MIDPGQWRRWPLLLGAAVCLAVAVTLFLRVDTPEGKVLAGFGTFTLAAALLGAFIYSEGTGPTNDREDDDGGTT